MIPVLAVFIDSLKPESVEYMEFLNSFESKARVKTELPSYSNTCHASIYTGVYPEKHKHFFIWKYSPETSPFKVFMKLKLHKLVHDTRTKYLLYAIRCKLKFGIVPYGYLFFAKHSLSFWAHFDLEMVKFWGKPDMYVGRYPTIFKILDEARIEYQVIWKPKGSLNKLNVKNPPAPFTYIFIGHIDPITHKYSQESSEAKRMLEQIDRVLEKVYFKFEKVYGDDFLFLVFSDHGQTEIKERVDLDLCFKSNGRNLKDYLHFIDSCYARFWFKNERERKEVEKVLSKLEDKGFILTEDILEKYHSKVPKNEYGELIFYLEPPYVFNVVDPKAICMHGYLPDHPDLDGVCVTNRKIIKGSYIKLQDIAPSILQALGLEVPNYMDGEPIWK